MRRRVLTAGSIAAVLLFGPTAAAATTAATEEGAIRAALTAWTEAFNARQTERICDLFARDLIADYRGTPQKTYESLCTGLREAMGDSARRFRYDLTIHEVLVAGDMAVVRLRWDLTVIHTDPPREVRSSDLGLDVFRRQPDGVWRIVRYLAYPLD